MYFTTQYTIDLGYGVVITPCLTVCNKNDILSPIPTRKNIWISSNYSLDVVLFVNRIMFQLLKVPNTGQYVKSTPGW